MRTRRFTLEGRRAFDGADRATVSVVFAASGPIFSVRPLRRRRPFELPLEDVARLVILRVAQLRARERLAVSKERKRAGLLAAWQRQVRKRGGR